MSITIGIDIGGTFTDVVSLDNESGELQYAKVNSTPPRLVDGFMKGADSVRRLASASFADVSRIAHGTTIGTNAILEARGSTIGILTTKGFEDVLTIGRQKRSDMYDVFIEPETPVFLAPSPPDYWASRSVSTPMAASTFLSTKPRLPQPSIHSSLRTTSKP